MSSYRRASLALVASIALGACNAEPPPTADLGGGVQADADVADAVDASEQADVPVDSEPDPLDVFDVAEDALDTTEDGEDDGDIGDEADLRDAAERDADAPPRDVAEEVYNGPIAPIGIDLCALQFADVLGTGVEQTVHIANRSDAAFFVTEILLPTEAEGVFEFAVELPLEVPPQSVRGITFRYTPGLPDAPDIVEYTIVMQQDDAERTVSCLLERISLPDICDTIDIEMSVVGDPLERSGRALGWAKPLDLVRLEAVPDNPEVNLEEIAWRVDNAPAFANPLIAESEEFPDSPTHREYKLYTPGSHRICADTISAGDVFCTECAEITTTFGDGLWLQVTLPFATTAVDLQLHVVRADQVWFDEAADSWPGSPGADWVVDGAGFAGAASSIGPSFAKVAGDCQWFAIGVFHNGGAPASPSLELFADNVFVDLLGGPELQAGEFWDAGRVHLPTNTFDPANLHFTVFEVGVDRPEDTPQMSRLELCSAPD